LLVIVNEVVVELASNVLVAASLIVRKPNKIEKIVKVYVNKEQAK
jgi:hypothetical protein